MRFAYFALVGFTLGFFARGFFDKPPVYCNVDKINREVIKCIDLVDKSNESLERCEELLKRGLGIDEPARD